MMKNGKGVTTSDRLLAMLDLFDLDRPDWSVEEAAGALDLATSTAYRYFASLTSSGMLAPFATGRYVLGPTIIRYDRQLRLTDPLISAADEEMQRIAASYPGQAVVFLCRLLGRRVMCVNQATSGDPQFAVGYQRGRLMPLFAGSASKVILAHLPPRQLKALFTRNPQEFASAGLGETWDQVRGGLREIRSAGRLVTHAEVDPGMRGISVPLIVENGALLASLNVAGPESFLTGAVIEEVGDVLARAVPEIVGRMRS